MCHSSAGKYGRYSIPFGITIFSLSDQEGEILGTAEQFLKTQSIPFAVCGLHKKDFLWKASSQSLGLLIGKCKHCTALQAVPSGYGTGKNRGMVYDDKKRRCDRS